MDEVFLNTYEPPQWLNKDFLQSALREGLRRDSLNVNNCQIKPATNVGDNYLSQMFRAAASLHSTRRGDEDMSMVIKSMPTGDATEKFVNEANFFKKEAEMFSKTLPALQKILEEINGPKLAAELHFKQSEPNYIFILEDLKQSGFRSVNRLLGLDLHHSILVAESLAVFHAASLIAIKQDETIKKTYGLCFWQRENKTNNQQYGESGLKALSKCAKKWGTLPVEFSENLEALQDKFFDKLYDSVACREDELNVLNHGDPWTSNLMFSYSNGMPKNMRFVDFQLTNYNSPVYDLIYFLVTSPRDEIKISHLNELLEKYHIKLTETCQKLNYPINFSLGDLRETFFRRLFFGFFLAIGLLPFMVAPSKDVLPLEDFLENIQEGTDDNIDMYFNDHYKKSIEVLLPFFVANGILD